MVPRARDKSEIKLVNNLVVPSSEARNGGAGDAGLQRHMSCSLIRDIRSIQIKEAIKLKVEAGWKAMIVS